MATLRQTLAQLSQRAARIDNWVRLRSPRMRALLPHWALGSTLLFALLCGCVGLLTPLYATGHASGGRVLIIELLATRRNALGCAPRTYTIEDYLRGIARESSSSAH